jgi:dienelactone hydrolase/predicted Ser/Thr protein kinase
VEAGTLLGHYRVIAKLGEGGMGAVYTAEDTKLGRQVALKLLPEGVAEDPERRQRFEREARAVAAITHPNVVVLYTFEEADGAHFLTMEHVEGKTLDEFIPDGGLQLERFLELALPLVGAVDAAHESGVIHRDLKPPNIMVTDDGIVKVLDFGLAKLGDIAREGDAGSALGTELPTQFATETGHIFGTPAYMSPEQLRGETADLRSDIFSLGIVLYEMASGANPFLRDTLGDTLAAILKEKPAPLARTAAGLPAGLRAVLQRMLSEKPDARPQLSDVREGLEKCRAELSGPVTAAGQLAALGRTARRPYIAVPLVLLGALVGYFTYAAIDQASQVRWARQVALPELQRLADSRGGEGSTMWDANELAVQVAEVIPDDPMLAELWSRVSFRNPRSISTDSPGARLYGRPYQAVDAEWKLLGTTPLEIRVPRGWHRWRFEKEGYLTRESLFLSNNANFSLAEVGSPHDEMVVVPGGAAGDPPMLQLPGLEQFAEPLADFLMDRFEVTNREYKEFVDTGGYTADEHWEHPFVADGRELSREDAMGRFVDRTGRPGPSTWEIGDYPEGEEDYPVSGVSWYEAAAYAAFVDKKLPTVFHWNRAAQTRSGVEVVPLSNLGGDRPVAVGSTEAMNRYGNYDLGGNVREWTLNASGDAGQHYILGGGWSDPEYAFVDAYAQPAIDRSEINGIRLMRYIEDEENFEALNRPLDRPRRDFLAEQPVDDETFEVFLRQFDYDESALEAETEAEDLEENWIHQTVSFNAAYGGERMLAQLLLPKTGKPPFQAVIVFPGSWAFDQPSSSSSADQFGYFVASGRAVVLPVYKSTWERQTALKSDIPNDTILWKDHVIWWVKDFSRTIDYLETRDDIDTDKLAYYGYSWGGAEGAIVPAVERRLKAMVLYVAGFYTQRARREVEPVNYIGRVILPTLMVNGQHDFYFPYETSQRPFLELLGTPDAQKNLEVFPGAHSAPVNEFLRLTLDWLDKYLGPVGQ